MRSIRTIGEVRAAVLSRHALTILLVATVLTLPRAASAAAPIIVGDGTAASCTENALQDALVAAHSEGGGTIRFRCGDAPVTIALSATTGAALTVPNNTTIDGDGLVTLQGFEIILVNPDASIVIKSLMIQGGGPLTVVKNLGALAITDSVFLGGGEGVVIANYGTLMVYNSTFRDRAPEWAIVNHETGTATVDRSAFLDNYAAIQNGGSFAVKNSILSGNRGFGGILNGGMLTIDNTEFSDNVASYGGAITNGKNGTLIIKNSTFARNRAEVGPGGGAIVNGGTTTIANCQFFNNEGLLGGAILGGFFNSPNSSTTIRNSTFSGNHAYKGGAIDTGGETLTISNSTIRANTADQDGGGIYAVGGIAPTLVRTSVSGNTPNDVVVQP